MKKNVIVIIAELIVIVSCLLSSNAFALGGYGTLSGDDKMVTDAIINNLGLGKNDAYNIYEKYVKQQLNTKDWQYNGFNNETLSKAKINKSDVKFFHINMVTDNRYVNISMHKYAKEKQVFIQVLETLPRQSNAITNTYNELKDDKEYKISVDKEYFSVFEKTGYTTYTKFINYSGAGGIQYIDFYVYDIGDN